MNTEEQTPPNDPKSELLALAAAVERPELLGQMSADLFFAHADVFRFLAEHRREIESLASHRGRNPTVNPRISEGSEGSSVESR